MGSESEVASILEADVVGDTDEGPEPRDLERNRGNFRIVGSEVELGGTLSQANGSGSF